MDPADTSRRLDELTEAVAGLARRVAALEQGSSRREASEPAASALPPAPSPALDLALAGRCLLVMAGAFLLRALANLDAVPDALGVALGLAYALGILGFADRSVARGRQAEGACYAATSLLVAYPLIAESALRLRILDVWTAALAAGAWFVVAGAIAARRRAIALAWIVAAGAPAGSLVLAFATRGMVPQAWLLVAMAAGTAWLGQRLGRSALLWPAAIAGDLLVLLLLPVFLSGRASPGIGTAPLCALALFLVFTAGTQARGRDGIFDRIQAGLALVIGLGGGAAMAVAAGAGVAFGAAGLATALAGSVAALRRLDGARLWFWSSLWLAAALVGLATLSRGPALPLASAAAGLALAARAGRAPALTALQACFALAVAAATSGLLAVAWRGLAGPPPPSSPPAPSRCCAVPTPRARSSRASSRSSSWPCWSSRWRARWPPAASPSSAAAPPPCAAPSSPPPPSAAPPSPGCRAPRAPACWWCPSSSPAPASWWPRTSSPAARRRSSPAWRSTVPRSSSRRAGRAPRRRGRAARCGERRRG
jgi:hypothetical protein